MGRVSFTASTLALAMALAMPAEVAAETDPGAAIAMDVRAGLEGGGLGYAEGVRRSRTIVRFGGDAWLFDPADDMIGLAFLAELEPHLGFGGELRYQRRLWEVTVVSVGPTAIFAPKTLVGGTLGFSYRPTTSETVELDVGPTGNVFFAGSDRPEGVVPWQILVNAGIRFRL
ncbi:MAG TPA: hypothetical protein ENK57_18965 [Polyangiaceae bacterium]|nr:hypothetical protein [Polyangiaceae bacterium]